MIFTIHESFLAAFFQKSCNHENSSLYKICMIHYVFLEKTFLCIASLPYANTPRGGNS